MTSSVVRVLNSGNAGKDPFNGASGQVAVEYVLLLIVGVTIAGLIISLVVSRNPDSPGFIITKWMEIIQMIGGDVVDP
jgi:hypothetical protein